MFFDFFKKRARVIDVNTYGERGMVERKNRWLILAIMAAICILAFGSCEGKQKDDEKQNMAEIDANDSKYAESMAIQLEEILSSVKGAGKVKVLMTFEAAHEKVLASNRKNDLETEVAEGGSTNKSSDSEDILLFESGGDEKPFVLKEKLPVPTGVLVTATGAGSESVRLEIYESVKALYGISGHRIKVAVAADKK